MSLEVWIPEGVVDPHTATVVGTQRVEISAYPYKWFNADIHNDGPDDVYCHINEVKVTKQPLRTGEHLEVVNGKPAIKKIILECDAGKTANVRIYTKR